MLPAVLASLAYRCSQVECSGWLSTIDARFNANLNGVYALQAGSSPFPGHTLENVVNQGQIKTLFLYPIDDPDYGKLWCIGDSDGSLNVKAYIIADGREPKTPYLLRFLRAASLCPAETRVCSSWRRSRVCCCRGRRCPLEYSRPSQPPRPDLP